MLPVLNAITSGSQQLQHLNNRGKSLNQKKMWVSVNHAPNKWTINTKAKIMEGMGPVLPTSNREFDSVGWDTFWEIWIMISVFILKVMCGHSH